MVQSYIMKVGGISIFALVIQMALAQVTPHKFFVVTVNGQFHRNMAAVEDIYASIGQCARNTDMASTRFRDTYIEVYVEEVAETQMLHENNLAKCITHSLNPEFDDASPSTIFVNVRRQQSI